MFRYGNLESVEFPGPIVGFDAGDKQNFLAPDPLQRIDIFIFLFGSFGYQQINFPGSLVFRIDGMNYNNLQNICCTLLTSQLYNTLEIFGTTKCANSAAENIAHSFLAKAVPN